MSSHERMSLANRLEKAGVRSASTRVGHELEELMRHWLRLDRREQLMLLELARDLANVGRPVVGRDGA